VFQQRREFNLLQASQKRLVFRRAQARTLAGINECERVPFLFWTDPIQQPFFHSGRRHFARPLRNHGKSGVPPHAMEPILGVAEIRLPPVHDAVNVTALGVGNVLRDLVRLVQVIVPEK
jgi:hypothetical protein